jgi:tetratricopeptide (TPR) repeat protein
LRGVPLHGHAIGHRMARRILRPGRAACCAWACSARRRCVGPIGLVAAAALGALRLSRGQTAGVALALIALGAALGPGLDRVAPALVAVGRESVLIGAWRIDRGQALPGDLARLQRASARQPDDALFRLALAVDQKRLGELERANEILGDAVSSEDPRVRSAALNLRGIASLAAGDLNSAIPAFERARTAQESAPVMFNLSQAYGRALRLSDQESAFQVASALDPDLVARLLSANGANVHTALIQAPISLSVYLARSLAPSAESSTLARDLREHLLGPVARERAWLALPILGALAFVLRRKSVARCSRCERPLCAKCSREAMKAGTCKRCVRLFVKQERTDPRLRKLQLDLDRRRQRAAEVQLAVCSLFAPGFADLLDGRFARGMLALFALGTGSRCCTRRSSCRCRGSSRAWAWSRRPCSARAGGAALRRRFSQALRRISSCGESNESPGRTHRFPGRRRLPADLAARGRACSRSSAAAAPADLLPRRDRCSRRGPPRNRPDGALAGYLLRTGVLAEAALGDARKRQEETLDRSR